MIWKEFGETGKQQMLKIYKIEEKRCDNLFSFSLHYKNLNTPITLPKI